MEKPTAGHPYNGPLLGTVTWMNLRHITLRERIQTQKPTPTV